MGVPLWWSASWSLRARAGSQTRWSGRANFQSNELGDLFEGLTATGGNIFAVKTTLCTPR